MNKQVLAGKIDHTILKQEATEADIIKLCLEARKYGFASVCINPCYVKLAVETLQGCNVPVCSVIGFPLGSNTEIIKINEAQNALNEGATELDMVLNVGKLKDHKYQEIQEEIQKIKSIMPNGTILKVIIEAALLSNEEKIEACKIVNNSGADFIKTSTGMNIAGGATLADVELLKKYSNKNVKVKAAGGIRTLADAISMINAGADRLGASAGIKILSEMDE